ncbi:MAG TPA: hypothetical protein VJ858_06225 [Acidimicrobiia bacterium]|nr:hypothetical protein [Acidimicrobiia bacterium]
MRLVLVATIVMALPACGGEEPASTTTSASASDSTTTSTESAPSTRVMAATTSTVSHIDVEFVEGDVVGPESVQVELGETVDLWVLSDVDDEIHVHGYDLFYDLEAGVPFHLTFLADVPGIFEVEVHTGHTRLLDIEVIG